MTERPRRRSRATQVYTVTGATFAVAATALGAQMATGHDPSLGSGAPAAPKTVATAPVVRRRVLIRRIEKTIIVTRILPPRSTGPALAGGGVAASSPSRVALPTQGAAPAPAAVVAPAPVAAPPPPAPVTRSS